MTWTRKLGVGLMVVSVGASAEAQRGGGTGRTVQAPRFEVDPLWPKPLPNNWLLGTVAGIAVDSRDHIYVLHLTDSFNQRTETGGNSTPPIGECCFPAPAVLEFDAAGTLLSSWGGPGQGYDWPVANHGIAIDPQGNIWIAGSGGMDTRVLKFSRDGKFLAAIGKQAPAPAAPAGRAGPDTAYQGVAPGRAGAGRGRGRGAPPPTLPPNSASMEMFGGAADISFNAAANEAYIADGFRNRRVVVVDMATGAFKRSFGAGGNAPRDTAVASSPTSTQFGTPVRCAQRATDGLLYVCDPINNRIQVFRANGAFVKQGVVAPATKGAGSVWDIAFSRDAAQRYLYVADGQNMKIRVLDRQTLAEITNFGTGGKQPGQFIAVQGVATDSRGNLYTGESSEGKRVQKFVYKGIGAVAREQGVLWPSAAAGRTR